MDNIDVVILCGGKGKRLKKITGCIPKPMAQIREKPFLNLLINYYRAFSLNNFILCTGYNADYIRGYYKKHNPGKGIKIIFSREKKPLDTAGAIKNAEKFIKSDTFLAVNGDSFCPLDLRQFIRFHSSKSALITVAVARMKNSKDFGSVVLDRSNRIIGYDEKKCTAESFVNAGVYLFQKRVLSMLPHNTRYSLEKELFPKLVGKNVFGFVSKEQFIDIGTPGRYEYAKKILNT